MVIALLIILIAIELLVTHHLRQVLDELRTMNDRYKVS